MAYDDDNVFARIIRGELPCHRVFEDDTFLAIMDILPQAQGHVLIIPKKPMITIFDAPDDMLSRAMPLARRIARAAANAFDADGITIFQNNSEAGGQSVLHFHLHIVPRRTGVPLVTHASARADDTRLALEAARIRERLAHDAAAALPAELPAMRPAPWQNVAPQAITVLREGRARIKCQTPCCIWFTGLSGSGKSTLANLVEKRLHARGCHTYLLDGDNLRLGLNRDLGFSEADRIENIRRVAHVAGLMVDSGLIVLASFISPFASDRKMAREVMRPGEFIEVYVSTPLDVCEGRDPKGLYRKARAGEIANFTGISSPYEPPATPEITIDGSAGDADIGAARIEQYIEAKKFVPA